MNKLTSFPEVLNLIKTTKDYHKGFITNFYPEVDKINSWIKSGKFHHEVLGETIFFLRENEGFSNLFYCSTSFEALNRSLSELNRFMGETLLVTDIIGKDPGLESVTRIFNANGFFCYTKLNRMTRSIVENEFQDTNADIKNASLSNSNDIFSLLHQYFDPIAEQLPTLEEINNWIGLDHLIIVEENGEILGFVIFDLIGITSYLRYWFVHPQHRNKKIGSTLLHTYFKCSIGTKRQLFWVIQTNDNAIKRYLHYGFLPENLFDHILTNKNIQYATTNY